MKWGTECIDNMIQTAIHTGITGIILGSSVAAWKTEPQVKQSMKQVVYVTYQTIKKYATVLAAAGAVYSGTECALKHIREKDDVWNRINGSILSGILLGIRKGSLSTACFAATTLVAITVGTEFSGLPDVSKHSFQYPTRFFTKKD
jgi:hypothetical protein